MWAIKPIFIIPSRTDRQVYLAVFYGVVLLVWLSGESTFMPLTALLGAGVAFGIVALSVFHRWGGRPLSIKQLLIIGPLWGAIVGALAVPMTFMLMLFKNVQHSHYYAPDFPNETLLGLWIRLPFWAMAGALLGLGWALWIIAKTSPQEDVHDLAA